jgi:hypothetical protein
MRAGVQNVLAGWLGIPIPPSPPQSSRPYHKTEAKRSARRRGTVREPAEDQLWVPEKSVIPGGNF